LFCKGNSLKKLGREEEAQQCITRAKELEKWTNRKTNAIAIIITVFNILLKDSIYLRNYFISRKGIAS
jgi:hypothetical protein